jgi:hypothetical protein
MIEQQLALNTSTGNAESFVNPQSPNNLIYLAKVNGQDAVSITDLNMQDDAENADKLLNYYQDKKLRIIYSIKYHHLIKKFIRTILIIEFNHNLDNHLII